MSYDFGTVVLIHFPQSGTTVRKKRPGIIVLDVGDDDLVIAPVTSKSRNRGGDISVAGLAGTGLLRPSWIRLAKVATLLKTDVVQVLGRLPVRDRNQLAQVWQKVYGGFVS